MAKGTLRKAWMSLPPLVSMYLPLSLPERVVTVGEGMPLGSARTRLRHSVVIKAQSENILYHRHSYMYTYI